MLSIKLFEFGKFGTEQKFLWHCPFKSCPLYKEREQPSYFPNKINHGFKTNMYILRISLIDVYREKSRRMFFPTYFLRPELSATNENNEPLKGIHLTG
jgi:hypothetical protein